MRHTIQFLLAATLCLVPAPRAAAAPWVVITEVHYAPLEGDAGEFIEIMSREPPRADLGGWTLEGDIEFRLPAETILLPGEPLVVAAHPAALSARFPGLKRVAGPYKGTLGDRKGRVALRNRAGALATEVAYRSGGRWPVPPAGTGHTLALLDSLFDPGEPENWASSEKVGGTPGAPNFQSSAAPEGSLIVRRGHVWRYWRGYRSLPAAWFMPDFDDRRWQEGASGFGYGDGDDATVFSDMRGGYLSLFTRTSFEVADPAALESILLRVDYDDGFVAYLNGREVARAGLGQTGRPVSSNQAAAPSHEAGIPMEVDLGAAATVLKAGRNFLAVQVHNTQLQSSDLSLTVEIESRKKAESPGSWPRPILNEVHLPDAGPGGFVEIHNSGDGECDLAGWFLSDDPKERKKFRLPSSARVPPRGFASFGARDLGDGFSLRGEDLHLILTRPDGETVADALRFEGQFGGSARGRLPDGDGRFQRLDAPTPGAPNRPLAPSDLVINEMLYRSPHGEGEEFIEIHNRGGAEASLDGYRLRGAVSFDFPVGSRLEPGGFIAVAREPETLAQRHGLAPGRILGPYRGRLSGRGEEIALVDPQGNDADRVEYADRDPWPRWADGMGSSLELIDPWLDNSLPGAWAASDERSRARWESFSYEKDHRTFEGRALKELQFMLLGEGECLIDDVRFGIDGGLSSGGDFEEGAAGWTALGTHERSGHLRGDGGGGENCYRIVADGRGNARHNYVARAVARGLDARKKYPLSFRAKWLRGSPLLLSRTAGHGVAMTHRLSLPDRIGTPGAENSTRVGSAAPVLGTPRQEPVLPSTAQPVRISVPFSARTPVREAWIVYRHEKDGGWKRAPLARRSPESRILEGSIPESPAGRVEFYLQVRDAEGREGTFPARAPAHTAHYAVGLLASKRFPTYTLLASDASWRSLAERQRLSNQLEEGTLIYGDSRIFYNVGFRRRGSPFTRSTRNWRIVFGAETLDGRRSLTLDGQGGDGTRLNERLTYWLADQLDAPNVRQQYVHFRIPGQEEGLYEDVEKVDGRFLERWFAPKRPKADGGAAAGASEAAQATPNAPASAAGEAPGVLHRVDDHFEMFPGGGQAFREADLNFRGEDPEDYRWNFPPRAESMREDFGPLFALLKLLDPRTTPDGSFDARAEESMDVDEWLRVLAARTLTDDWDTLGLDRGKNALFYLTPSRPDEPARWRLLPWDCDLAWRDPSRGIVPHKFRAIQRLLGRPAYERRYHAYLAYLCERKFAPAHFAAILADCSRFSGAQTDSFAQFAAYRRDFVLRMISRSRLRVAGATRIVSRETPDILRVSGTAPAAALRFRLNGREAPAKLEGRSDWSADFPIGPDGGENLLQALDFGGYEVARAMVRVDARPGAAVLPEDKEARDLLARALETPSQTVQDPERATWQEKAGGSAPRPVVHRFGPVRHERRGPEDAGAAALSLLAVALGGFMAGGILIAVVRRRRRAQRR